MSQKKLDAYRELNRYDDRTTDIRSSAVYEEPRRTAWNGWKRFHAARDCGRATVRYIERSSRTITADRYKYDLYCGTCGYTIPEDEVLFIGGDWYSDRGFDLYPRPVEDLHIPPERVCELGPDPDREELEDALKLSWIEHTASLPLGAISVEDPQTCDSCDATAPITFDGECGTCYGGPWTTRMEEAVRAYANKVRIHNDSYAHRLPTKVDPAEPGDTILPGRVLWRRTTDDGLPKLVRVEARVEDIDNGEERYRLMGVNGTDLGYHSKSDVVGQFYDTEIGVDLDEDPLSDERIRELSQDYCDHRYTTFIDRNRWHTGLLSRQCRDCGYIPERDRRPE